MNESEYITYKFCNERHRDVCRRLTNCEDRQNSMGDRIEDFTDSINKRVDDFHNKLLTIILLMVGNLVGVVGVVITILNVSFPSS
jgi:hypothetical protein